MKNTRLPKCVTFGELVGGRGLRGRPRKRMDGVPPGRLQSFRYQRRQVDDCSPGRGGMAQDGRTRGETFHGEMDRRRERQGWTTAWRSMSERDGDDQDRIAQSKRVRTGSLAIVDTPRVARTCNIRAFDLQMSCCLSPVLSLFCFVSFSSFCFH